MTVGLEGVDGSEDSQGFAGPEGLQVRKTHRIRGERSPGVDPADILAQMFGEVNQAGEDRLTCCGADCRGESISYPA